MEEHSESLDVLERRLSTLEKLIVGNIPLGTNRAPFQATVSTRAQEISKEAERIFSQPDIAEFLAKYEEFKKLVEVKHEIVLDAAGKRALIMTNEDFIRDTARSLQTIQEHEKFINSENFQVVPSLLQKLTPLEAVAIEQNEQLSDQQQHFDGLLKSYNEIIQLLSEKFTYWDRLLGAWEVNVDKNKAMKGAST
eukprot:TRINITY_DN3128_c0_g1_i1.p1 TRINITY_DN3128_c0_g1~~TRINITY_DN3128_c0_g1_i1.p1  ORF type:complete len:194 (-),score=38.54 TRINITY_DN3128_c0_g1_i1:48-629(-)